MLVGQKNNDGWVLRVDGNGDVIQVISSPVVLLDPLGRKFGMP